MKAIKTRPFQRPLLVVLSLTILTGCSGLPSQSANIYKDLEQKVKYAYNTTIPVQQQGIIPALFKTVSVPGMDLLKNPIVFKANHRSGLTVPGIINPFTAKPKKQDPKELRYIEQFYGL